MGLSVGLALVQGFGGVAALVGTAELAFSFAAFALSLGLSVAARMLMSSASDTGAQVLNPGRLQVIRSAQQPRRVIYGETLVSGTLVFAGTGGNTVASTPGAEYMTVVSAQWTEWGPVSMVGQTTMTVAQTSATAGGSFDFASGSAFTIAGDATTYTLTADPVVVYSGSETLTPAGCTISFTPGLVAEPATNAATTLQALAPISAAAQGGGNDYLYLVIALAGHEVEEIGTVWFNDTPEYDASLDGFVTLNRHLGVAPQTADASLVAAFPADWTAAHRLDGVAYITCILKWDASVWQSGIPNITAVVKGKKLYDPRDAGTRWSNNWALAIRDYLTSADGLGCDSAEIDDTSIIAAANIADEVEALVAASWDFTAATSDELTLVDDTRRLRSGDAVTVASSGTLPAGLSPATTYYVMRRGPTGDQVIKLCATWAAAMAGTGAIDITNAGSGTHSITVASQRRYTADGSFDLDVLPQDNLAALTTAGAGMTVCQGGVWKVLAGAWRAPTKTITDDMLAGPLKVQARTPKADLYNSVKGVYSAPANQWQTSDFAPVTNATYVGQDNGETIWHDIALPFTTDSVRAQRIAKILLEKSRQQITASLVLNLAGLSIAAGDTVAVTNTALGWTAKAFTVTSWTFDASGVALTLQEEASTCYDWDLGDETVVDAAPDTTLQPNWAILSPQGFLLYQGVVRAGDAWRTLVTCRWNPPLDTRVAGYRLRGRHQGGDWVTLRSLVQGNRFEYDGVLPGDYDIAIQSMAMNGAASDWVQESITVLKQSDLLGTFGLPPPSSAVLRLGWSGQSTIDRARLTLTLGDVPFTAEADAVMLCMAIFDHPNMIPIFSGGTGDTLQIYNAAEAIISRGTWTTLAGSTAAQIQLRTATDPFVLHQPNATRFWGALTHWDWRKAQSYDLTSFTFDPAFAGAPSAGATLDYVELSWYDERPLLTRYGILTKLDANNYPTGAYEIVRWQGVTDIDGFITITGVLRGQEGTTPINVDSADYHLLYYPAPGAGTTSTVFPIATWQDMGGGVWQGDVDIRIEVKPGQWCAPISCGLYKVVGTDLIRSALVPVTFGGTI